MKNVFDDLINRLDMAKGRTNNSEDRSIETSQTKKSERKKRNSISKNCGIIIKDINTYIIVINQKTRKN